MHVSPCAKVVATIGLLVAADFTLVFLGELGFIWTTLHFVLLPGTAGVTLIGLIFRSRWGTSETPWCRISGICLATTVLCLTFVRPDWPFLALPRRW